MGDKHDHQQLHVAFQVVIEQKVHQITLDNVQRCVSNVLNDTDIKT